jgi:hypothetical protein
MKITFTARHVVPGEEGAQEIVYEKDHVVDFPSPADETRARAYIDQGGVAVAYVYSVRSGFGGYGMHPLSSRILTADERAALPALGRQGETKSEG